MVEFTNPRVLITDAKIEGIKEIIPVLEQVTRLNQPLLIIAEDVTGELLPAATAATSASPGILSLASHASDVNHAK